MINDTASVLELVGVSKVHPGPVAALRSVSVTIRTGEFAAIVGPSGSGKSTMLAIAGTLERPTAGSVRVAGLVVDGLPDRALSGVRAGRIGFVFQQFFLIPTLTERSAVTGPGCTLDTPISSRALIGPPPPSSRP